MISKNLFRLQSPRIEPLYRPKFKFGYKSLKTLLAETLTISTGSGGTTSPSPGVYNFGTAPPSSPFMKCVSLDYGMLITSDIGIKDNNGNTVTGNQVTHFPTQNFAWNMLQDLGITLLNINGGMEGNIAHIQCSHNHPYGIPYDTYWAQNLNALLTKANSYGVKVVLHEMGDPNGVQGPLCAPMDNASSVNPYTSQGEAITCIDRMGDPTQNAMNMNFLADSRIAWWHPINEAVISQGNYVANWITAVLAEIQKYGGKTGVCVTTGTAYWQSFPNVLPIVGAYENYPIVHDYGEGAIEQVSGQGGDMYSIAYALFNSQFSYMVSSAKAYGFSSRQLFDMESGCPLGSGVKDVAGATVTISAAQQAAYVQALYDAAKENALGGVCYWEILSGWPSQLSICEFIDYYGNIKNQTAYNNLKAE